MQHRSTICRLSTFAAGLVVAAGLIAACGTADSPGGFGSGGQFSISAALKQIPLSPAAGEDGSMEIYVTDLLAASEATGRSRPTGSTDRDELTEWLLPMVGVGQASESVFLPTGGSLILPGEPVPLDEYRDEIGFTVTEVDAAIESSFGTNSITVLAGDIQPSATVEVASGVLTFGEGEDFEVNLGARTPARPLGRALRTASADGLVLLTPSTDTALSWLDETSARLDSDQDFALVATILDERDLISAALWRSDFSALAEDTTDTPIKTPFSTVAVGWGVIDDEASITVVYVTADDSAATAAAEQIAEAFSGPQSQASGRPISDVVTLEDATPQGRAVVVSLKLAADEKRPGALLDMFYRRDSQFLYDAP